MKGIIRFKPEVNMNDLTKIYPKLWIVLAEFQIWCFENQQKCVITSIIGNTPGRKFSGHSQGRCFDASTRGWEKLMIYKCKHFFNKRFREIAAFSKSDGVARLCIYHKVKDGKFHLHFQLRP